MASADTLCRKLLNVKDTVVESHEFFEVDGVGHLRIHARPNAWHRNDCPYCGKRCAGYDQPYSPLKTWRSLDFAGIVVEIVSYTHRIVCPEHGIVTAAVPWAYPGSRFTKDFDLTVAWLAEFMPRTAISRYMRIDWQTVGSSISRSLEDLEPERARRLDGLVNIGIDETSYRKGHKYITVVVNHDTNTVVWIGEGHGKSVLEQFYKSLSPEQLASIKVVTGDGARWITDCVNKFTPDCERCIDPFHVTEWALDALDELRKEIWRDLHDKARNLERQVTSKRGRPKTSDTARQRAQAAKEEASAIKKSAYALGKAPENLTDNQRRQLKMLEVNDPKLYRGYRLKECLRLLLKSTDVESAESELNHWLWWASHSRLEPFHELYKKIKRHKEHILNTIRLGFSNARIEATNNKIKLIVRRAYGFRNIQNMMDMIYLICSDIQVPLPNRKYIARQPA